MDAKAVAEYLKQNPKFFEDYADVVAEIFVPHPHGGHAIPIAERQIVTLREKNGELEQRLRELIRYGSENDAIGEKLHRSTLALFAAPDLETTLAVLYHSLKEDFARAAGRLPPVGTRARAVVPARARRDRASSCASTPTGWARPYCGPAAPFETARLVRDAGRLQVVRVPAAAHRAHLRPAGSRERGSGALLSPAWAPST